MIFLNRFLAETVDGIYVLLNISDSYLVVLCLLYFYLNYRLTNYFIENKK